MYPPANLPTHTLMDLVGSDVFQQFPFCALSCCLGLFALGKAKILEQSVAPHVVILIPCFGRCAVDWVAR